jgi:hypothetical protein
MNWIKRFFSKNVNEYHIDIQYWPKGAKKPEFYHWRVKTTSIMKAVYATCLKNNIDTDNVSFCNLGRQGGSYVYEIMEL